MQNLHASHKVSVTTLYVTISFDVSGTRCLMVGLSRGWKTLINLSDTEIGIFISNSANDMAADAHVA